MRLRLSLHRHPSVFEIARRDAQTMSVLFWILRLETSASRAADARVRKHTGSSFIIVSGAAPVIFVFS